MKCSKCQEKKELAISNPPICKTCYFKNYKRPHQTCSVCKLKKEPHKKINKNEYLCDSCYRKIYVQPRKKCIICGKKRIIKKNSENGPICKKCYKTSLEKCQMCEKYKEVHVRKDGCAICQNCYNKKQRQEDVNWKIAAILRSRFYAAFINYSICRKVKKADEYGINYFAIIEHLKPFPKNIENYHIDHILPLCAFDFNNPIHIKAAFAPENHQWLKKEDNMKKNRKYNKTDFINYIKKYEK